MAPLRIRVTRHLVARMTQRGIGFDLLRETIRDPDSTEPARDGRVKAVRRWSHDTCVVIGERFSESEVRATTAYFRRG